RILIRLTFGVHSFAPVQALPGFGVTITAAKGWQTGFPLRELETLMQLYGVFGVGTRTGQNRLPPLPGPMARSRCATTQDPDESFFATRLFRQKRQGQRGNVTRVFLPNRGG